EPEAPGRHDADLREALEVLGTPAQPDLSVDHPASRGLRDRTPPDGGGARGFGERGAESSEPLVLTGAFRDDVVGAARAPHELLQRLPVALEERRALRLAV